MEPPSNKIRAGESSFSWELADILWIFFPLDLGIDGEREDGYMAASSGSTHLSPLSTHLSGP